MEIVDLWRAVESRDHEVVLALLSSGTLVDKRAPSGLTPLMIAAGQGDAVIVKSLLDHGADAHCVDARAGVSVLHKACQGGNLDVVRLLVEEGRAFIDLPAATTGHTALMDALWYKWPDIVEYLLSKGAGLGLSTHYGFNFQQHVDYERSVNFFHKDRFDRADRIVLRTRQERQSHADSHALMSAVVAGDVQAMHSILLNSNVDVDERFPILNMFNDWHTPLHVACRDGFFEGAAILLKVGADANAVEPVFGAAPLHKAVYNGHARVTQLLVDHPGINLNFQGATNGYTPLHDALWHGFAECALILIQKGARLDLRGHDGKLPIDLAHEVFGATNQVFMTLQATAKIVR